MAEPISVPVHSVRQESANTFVLRFDWPLDHRPGQAIRLQLPGDSKKRFFSIASSPTEKIGVEVAVKTDGQPALRNAIQQLAPGTAVTVSGPLGALSLPPALDRPLCFIAAGSGITPFRSMAKYLIDQRALPETWIFHSAKTPEGLVFRSSFEKWGKEQSELHYIPTVTGTYNESWQNETGRISEAMMRKHVQVDAQCFLLCGAPAFVADMEALLLSMDIEPTQIRREQW